MTNELFFAGAVVVANRFGVQIDKVVKRKNQCGSQVCKIRLKNLGRT